MFYFITKMKLSKLLKKLNAIPNINKGGCGWAALCIYDWLQANNRLAPDAAIAFLHSSDCLSLADNLVSPEDKKIPSTHVMVFNNGEFIDSHGFYRKSKGKLTVRDLTVKSSHIAYGSIEGLIHALKNSSWNPEFNVLEIDHLLPDNLNLQ